MTSYGNTDRYGGVGTTGYRAGEDNNTSSRYNTDHSAREHYTGAGSRGGVYDRENFSSRNNDYGRDNDHDRGYMGGNSTNRYNRGGYNDSDNYGRGGQYGVGHIAGGQYGGQHGGQHSGQHGRDHDRDNTSYGGNRDYDRDYSSNRQAGGRSNNNNSNNTEDDDEESGFSQVYRKMRDLERNFMGSMFGGNDNNKHGYGNDNNSSLMPYSGGAGAMSPFGGNKHELGSMMGRNMATPSVVEEDGKKQLQWRFNAAGFNPDEVRVSTTGNNALEVHARHEDKGKHHAQVREFTRIVQLPEGISAQDVKTRINNQGLLTINVPYTGKALNYDKGRDLPLSQGGSNNSSASNNNTTSGRTGATGTTGQHNTSTTSGQHTGTTGLHTGATTGNTNTSRNNQ